MFENALEVHICTQVRQLKTPGLQCYSGLFSIKKDIILVYLAYLTVPLRFSIAFSGQSRTDWNLLDMFLVVGEARAPGGNLHKHKENIQTPHWSALSDLGIKLGTFFLWSRALTTVLLTYKDQLGACWWYYAYKISLWISVVSNY